MTRPVRTRAEHYAEAERLLSMTDGTDIRDALIVSIAQVHATLASCEREMKT